MMDKQKNKKTLPNIFTVVQRGNVNIKGRETGIRGTGDRILHCPYPPFQAVRDPPSFKKKRKEKI